MRQLAGQPEDSRQIDFDDTVPVGIGHAHEQAVLCDAGIVDEDVDTLEFGFSLLAKRLDGVAVGKVGWKELDPVAEFARKRFQLLHARAMQPDDRALRVQHPGNRFADASRCAGNKRLAAGQFEHFCLPISEHPWHRCGQIASPPRFRARMEHHLNGP